MVITKESDLVVVKTYGATSFNIFPPLQRLLVNHKCGLMALRCKSHLIFTLSFALVTIFNIFLSKFCSQCITSMVNQIKTSYINHNTHILHMVNLQIVRTHVYSQMPTQKNPYSHYPKINLKNNIMQPLVFKMCINYYIFEFSMTNSYHMYIHMQLQIDCLMTKFFHISPINN
jgi:hypothetical protein